VQLDGEVELAKQVLSQLSYTPAIEAASIPKSFPARRNPFLRIVLYLFGFISRASRYETTAATLASGSASAK
jgi:hypothetical protein